jgi:hypothetical protein
VVGVVGILLRGMGATLLIPFISVLGCFNLAALGGCHTINDCLVIIRIYKVEMTQVNLL